jgi:hypothetical protein
MIEPDSLPYRPCVGVVLIDARGLVFAGQRIDSPSPAWQMPQGGIDEGETPREAAYRELSGRNRRHPRQGGIRRQDPIPELYVSHESAQKLKHDAAALTSWDLTPRQVCDLELLMNGGFHPLKGFMTEADYDGVVANMRTASARSGRCRSRWTSAKPSPKRSKPARTSRCATPKA